MLCTYLLSHFEVIHRPIEIKLYSVASESNSHRKLTPVPRYLAFVPARRGKVSPQVKRDMIRQRRGYIRAERSRRKA